MRLLYVKTKQLKDFHNATDVPYAILSHCWEDDEVLYQDIVNNTAQDRKGYEKISKFCDVAARDGFQYVWIDTCCIDKSSSAELSEAINSMFNWYQQADVCFAYLSDCAYDDVAGLTDLRLEAGKVKVLHASKWFTRGWTLQELIAPRTVVFLSSEWKEFGTKRNLRSHIREITNIHEDALVHPSKVAGFCVAQRLSWAASRTTTRPEDQAYSLMGLLNVNMPLLYGEGGEDAFTRLQLEILRRFNDQSIFAWKREKEESDAALNTSGVLADSVRDFKWCHSINFRPKDVFRGINMGEQTSLSQVVGPFVRITGPSVKYSQIHHDFLRSMKSRPSSMAVTQQPQTTHFRSLSHDPKRQSSPIPHIPDWLRHVYGQFKGPSVNNHWLSNLCIMLLEECFSSEGGMIGILLHQEQNTYTRAHYPSIVVLPKRNSLKGDTTLQSKTFHVLSYPPKPTTGARLVKTIHLLTQPALYNLSKTEPGLCSRGYWPEDKYVDCGDRPHWCARHGNEQLSWLDEELPPLSLRDWMQQPDFLKTIPMFLLYSPIRDMVPPLPSILLWFSIDEESSLEVQFNIGEDAHVRSLIGTKDTEGPWGGSIIQSSTDSHGDIRREVATYEPLREGVQRRHLFDEVWLVVKMREGRKDIYLHIELDGIPT